jgi:hypothetical protein
LLFGETPTLCAARPFGPFGTEVLPAGGGARGRPADCRSVSAERPPLLLLPWLAGFPGHTPAAAMSRLLGSPIVAVAVEPSSTQHHQRAQ